MVRRYKYSPGLEYYEFLFPSEKAAEKYVKSIEIWSSNEIEFSRDGKIVKVTASGPISGTDATMKARALKGKEAGQWG